MWILDVHAWTCTSMCIWYIYKCTCTCTSSTCTVHMCMHMKWRKIPNIHYIYCINWDIHCKISFYTLLWYANLGGCFWKTGGGVLGGVVGVWENPCILQWTLYDAILLITITPQVCKSNLGGYKNDAILLITITSNLQ